jgi:4-aminobutyrate aminotransferase-like enzyme
MYPTNGGWPPHVHFQLITDLLGRDGEFPGVAPAVRRDVWLSLSPDPNLILGIDEKKFPVILPTREQTLAARRQFIGRNLSISYRSPLKIVRGSGAYLFDDEGRGYLDCINNVAHVGHCHPKVVRAAQRQIAVLNTNTRYLHDNIIEYARRLTAKLPAPLSVCFFVNSGSEANDLALRLASAHVKSNDVIVMDTGYHGNLTSLIDISPYKFDGPGGAGAAPRVHKLRLADSYRGGFDVNDIRDAVAVIGGPAVLFMESLLSCAGQMLLPPGYLADAYRMVRKAGGLCVADEVQVGFGRVGSHYWGFETQGVVPDIVTLGKSIGNGHPLGAVMTTPDIAASFNNGMEYFNTFGGNPVSCAVGTAVLDVIENERLQDNALSVGEYLKSRLSELKQEYPLIGDVRGLGLFIGIEFVRDRASLEPAPEEATYIVERMKNRGILLSTDGKFHNVIKIKPPMVFSQADADFVVDSLRAVLAETALSSTVRQGTR